VSAPLTPTSDDRAARATWAAHYATREGFRYMPAEELVRFCGRQAGRGWTLGRVLEVGCGNGANLWYLAEQSHLAVGVDFCGEALQAAREICRLRGCGQETCESRSGRRVWKSPAVLVSASAGRLPFGAGTFDTVVDLMVSQHMLWREHDGLYREYRRVLRPGGAAFLYHLVQGTSGSVPRFFDYPKGIDLFPAAGRVCLPDQTLLAATFERSGFGAVEQRSMERSYPDGSHARYAVIEGFAR
jgi:SAM-dependent methyltransferase